MLVGGCDESSHEWTQLLAIDEDEVPSTRGWKSRFKQELTTWFQFRTDSNDERVAKIQSIVSPTDAVC